MKKLFILGAALAFSASAIQAEPVYRLTKAFDEGWSYDRNYEWDAQGRLKFIREYVDFDIYYELFYDEAGNVVGQDLYQYLDAQGDYVKTGYLEYTYDENGRLLTRTNYNSFKDAAGNRVYKKSATYYSTYDENGNLVSRDLYFMDADENQQATAYSTESYTYENNLLQTYNSGSSFGSSTLVEYLYDDENRLTCEATTSTDMEGESEMNYVFYEYAENGDLVNITRSNDADGRSINSMNVFTYSDVPASRVIYPKFPEQDYMRYDYYELCNHQLEIMEEYGIVDTSGLQVMNTWEYEYEEVDPSGIEAIETAGNFLGVNVIGNTLTGLEGAQSARIYDVNGRMVRDLGAVNGPVSVSDLAKGIYLISSDRGTGKFRR